MRRPAHPFFCAGRLCRRLHGHGLTNGFTNSLAKNLAKNLADGMADDMAARTGLVHKNGICWSART